MVEEGARHALQLELSPGGGAMVSILDALDEVLGSRGSALAEGPFLDVLRSMQVRCRVSVAMDLFSFFPWNFADALLVVAIVGSRSARGDRAAASEGVGVRPRQRARAQRRAAHHPAVPTIQRCPRRWPISRMGPGERLGVIQLNMFWKGFIYFWISFKHLTHLHWRHSWGADCF